MQLNRDLTSFFTKSSAPLILCHGLGLALSANNLQTPTEKHEADSTSDADNHVLSCRECANVAPKNNTRTDNLEKNYTRNKKTLQAEHTRTTRGHSTEKVGLAPPYVTALLLHASWSSQGFVCKSTPGQKPKGGCANPALGTPIGA